MSKEFRPRENDHLVEPMFEALREQPANAADGGRSAHPWRWVALLLVCAIALVVIVALRGCGVGETS